MSIFNDYNQIDFENDSLTVIRAKIGAITKALDKRANEISNDEEKEEIKELLKKPLGEWP